MSVTTFPATLLQLPGVEDKLGAPGCTGIEGLDIYNVDTSPLDDYLSQEIGLTSPAAVLKTDEWYIFVSPYPDFDGYNTFTCIWVAGVPPEIGEEVLSIVLGGGGGGLDCEQLKDCLFTQIDPEPSLFEEFLERGENDELLFNYSPVPEPIEELELPFDLPFRKLEDIIPILQLMSRQIAEMKWYIRNELTAAAFPEWNQIRVERKRPIGVFQSARLRENGKFSGAPYMLQVPWVRPMTPEELPSNFYWKSGKWQYMRILPDNSKIIVYAISQAEGLRMVDFVSQYIQPEKLAGYKDKPTKLDGWGVNEEWRILKYFSYWETEEAQPRPDWSVLMVDYASLELPPGFPLLQ